jgi:hypothetical protein
LAARINDKRCGSRSANMLAPVKLLKLGLIAPHRQQWDNRRDQVYVTKLALQVTPVDPICAIMTKHKIHPTTTHFLRAKGSLREAQRERGNIIWSAAFHMLELVRATSLFRAAPGNFFTFAKRAYTQYLGYIYSRGCTQRSHLNNSSISNMFSKVKSKGNCKMLR